MKGKRYALHTMLACALLLIILAIVAGCLPHRETQAAEKSVAQIATRRVAHPTVEELAAELQVVAEAARIANEHTPNPYQVPLNTALSALSVLLAGYAGRKSGKTAQMVVPAKNPLN